MKQMLPVGRNLTISNGASMESCLHGGASGEDVKDSMKIQIHIQIQIQSGKDVKDSIKI